MTFGNAFAGLSARRTALAVMLLIAGATSTATAAQKPEGPSSPPIDAGPDAVLQWALVQAGPMSLERQVNQKMSLAASRIVTLDLNKTPGQIVEAMIELNGEMFTLHLEPHSVRGTDYQVLAQVADGRLVPVPAEPVRTLRGRLLEWPGSRASGSMFEEGLGVIILTPDGERYGLEPLSGKVEQAGPNQYVLYRASDVIKNGGTCGVKDQGPGVVDLPGGIAGGVIECADLACDADFEYYQDHGSNVATVQTQINNVINNVNNQYETEVQLSHLIGTIIVRTVEPDPYDSTDPNTLLNQVQSEWNLNQSSVVRDVVHMFTGKELAGTIIGIAQLSVVCNEPNAYGLVQSDFDGAMTCKSDLSAHELGHNWSAQHCDCPGTTMHPSIQCANTFAASSITQITNFAGGLSCIGPCENGTTTLPFFDAFPITTINPALWTGFDGATINTTASGSSEPSDPNSLNLDGNANGGDQIRSAIINTTNINTLTLEYYYERTGGGNSPETGDDLVVEYIADNGLWTELHRQLGSGADQTTFTFVSTALPSDAKHDSFRLRFRAISNQAGSDDWFVDDVHIFASGFPGNDNCANATAVSAGSTPFTTLGASTDGPDETTSCNFNAYTNIDFDVWYLYTAQCTGTASIGLCGADFDSKMAIYGASCPVTSGTTLACANNSCGDDPQVTIPVTQGSSYRIRVGGNQNSFGTGTLSITCFPAATNDNCANALVVSAGNTLFSTIGASTDGPAEPTACNFAGYNNIDNDLWFLYTPLCTGTATIGLCGADFDSKMAIYGAACPIAAGSTLACANNTCGDDAQVTIPVTSGSTYRIRVGGHLGGAGTGTLAISCSGPTSPANDACANAVLVTCSSQTAGTTVGATLDAGLPDCSPVSPSPGNNGGNVTYSAPGVWYRIVGTGNTITADTLTSSYNTRLHVLTGSCGNFTCVTANDDISSGLKSKVSFQTVLNQTYYILVSGSGSTTGTFTLNITCEATPANDNCASAQVIGPSGGSIAGTTVGATGAGFSPNSDSLATCATNANDPLFDVWYSYTAPCSGTLTLGTCGTHDTLLSVHTACPTLNLGNQVVGACNDNGSGPCSPGSQVTLSVNSGTNYRIRVAGAVGINAGGGFTLTWSLLDTDGDGTPDGCDGCPNDPFKLAPGVCGCGTPDTDSDGDGVPNCNDGCPNDPNKTSPGTCGCGIPDTDSDGDGTPNCNDGCPSDPNKTSPGTCGCGIPDTDSDGDGTPNCNDGCPSDPNKTSPGTCGCGIPDTDSDGDGTPNCNDGCPNDPNKTSPGTCGCGVPDADSDGDATPDCNDGCPSDPNKTAPGQCGCGAPDVDSDGDGTLDCFDGCPNDPNKIAPGACGCDVPDIDSDADGAPDCNDGCPNDPNKIAPGQCGCGIPDTDSDGDGVADCNDGCPNDPNLTEPGKCGCGTPDTDGDGTPDCDDGCPKDPAKTEPGDCGCGVPDTDSDGDGTPDCNDGCPDDPIKTNPGICGCGVSDVDTDGDGIPDCNDNCPGIPNDQDTDGDGIPDCEDGCPFDPLKTSPGICGCGVADVDTDGDGALDCIEACPDDPNKTNPGICGCGVPDDDTDGDGTPDCNDGCPDDPDKIAAGQCGCGVPEDDADFDGVPDCVDNCPAVANPKQQDCDNDGIGDACSGEPDCNRNNIPDSCDIAGGSSLDANENGIPDECEQTPCIGDISGGIPNGPNGVVDVDDLLTLINAWGDCLGDCPPYCVSDLSNNCTVDVDDLLILINHWGGCQQ